MPRTSRLMTLRGDFLLHEVDALGNQAAVVDGRSIYVADTGCGGINAGIGLAAAGAVLDLGLLAWPALDYGWEQTPRAATDDHDS